MGFEPTADDAGLIAGVEDRAASRGVDYAAGSDPGCEREANEDRYLATRTAFGMGYFVFDGMGGAPCGAAAAQVSSDAINEFFTRVEPRDIEHVIHDSVQHAQESLLASRRSPEMANMGTTVVGAFVAEDRVAIASIGDSRAYRIGDGFIDQLTTDHTLVQQLVEAGHITPADALNHPQSHVLTRCLGSESNFQIDATTYWLWPTSLGQRGEILLLCSDGLYSLVSDEEICDIVCEMRPQEAVEKLIALARERGGFDNITVLIKPLSALLRDRPPRRRKSESVSRENPAVAPPESGPGDGVSEDAAFLNDYVDNTNARGSLSNVKQLLILGVLAGFAAVLTFVILTMLRG